MQGASESPGSCLGGSAPAQYRRQHLWQLRAGLYATPLLFSPARPPQSTASRVMPCFQEFTAMGRNIAVSQPVLLASPPQSREG